jgi:hypothetical protein
LEEFGFEIQKIRILELEMSFGKLEGAFMLLGRLPALTGL